MMVVRLHGQWALIGPMALPQLVLVKSNVQVLLYLVADLDQVALGFIGSSQFVLFNL